MKKYYVIILSSVSTLLNADAIPNITQYLIDQETERPQEIRTAERTYANERERLQAAIARLRHEIDNPSLSPNNRDLLVNSINDLQIELDNVINTEEKDIPVT